MFRSFFHLVLFFLSTLPLCAEYKSNVHTLSRREGLSNGAVNTIVQDAEGYIWFGTWNGLNRYDGSKITTYLPGIHPNSIHNHVIRELYPASSGSLWILTNRGIALYDNIHDRFTSFFTGESDQINYENDIALSYSDGSGTLASVFGSGVFNYDSTSGEFIRIVFDTASIDASLSIKRIHQIDKLVYCITENGRLMMISGNCMVEVLQLPLTGILTSSVSILINRHPYILITQRAGAALMVDLERSEVQQLRIPDDVITSFSLSKEQNRIWAGTEKGRLYRFNLINQNFEKLNRLPDLNNNNPIATRILSIYESNPDILWIGTDGNGVYSLRLTEFPNTSLSSAQLAYPIVRSILVTHTGDILIGTKGGGIDVFDTNGKRKRGISVKNGLSNNSVLSFHERADGSIWVGTDGKGVDIISPDYKSIRNYPRDFMPGTADFGSVYRIIEDFDQRIYLGTSGYGVIMVEFDKNNLAMPVHSEQLVLDKSIDPGWQQKQIVYALASEKPGIIWAGTRGMGVFRYNTITKRIIAQYSTTSHPGPINNDDILSMLADQEGNIWCGSSNGIFSLHPITADSVVATGFSDLPDLFNTSIHAMQLDKPGNLWVTTNNGLSFIETGKRKVRSYNVYDGLINFEYSDGASFFDHRTGKLYVGGTMGVDIIKTSDIKFSSYFPPFAVNQLFIKNIPVEMGMGDVLSSRVNHQKTLTLSHNQNSLSFYVTPLAYWGQDRHRISYRLTGFDDQWVIKPQDQPIIFSNLKPGRYSLQMRVSDENGDWPDSIRQLLIIINPPFWLTIWAIAGYILLLIGVQLLIIALYRRREARKKEAALKEFQQKKEEELQSYKIEFFTSVAHEFRTPLTLISSHIHALLEDSRNAAKNPRLLKVFNNSIKLQKLVLEIMQFRKLEKGKEPLNIQPTKPVELVREVVSDLELFAQQGNIRCEVISSDPHLMFKTDADKFQRIVTNLISNAIKYNKPGGFVKASVKYEQSALVVEIEDNGIGIRPEYSPKVFEPFGISPARKMESFPGYRSAGLGLAVTKGLVELMKGKISFTSIPDEGTRFTCIFPDVHEINSGEPLIEQADGSSRTGVIDEPNPDPAFETSGFSSNKPLILLIDDDPEMLLMLQDFLQADYDIIFAENGRDAYHKVITDKPDLIVSDVVMPEMDGIELCCRLRENFDTSHLPIILLAAKAEIEDRIAGLKAGADSYIAKPFHPDHLKVRILKLLQLRAGILNQFNKPQGNQTLLKEIPDPFFQKLLCFIDENIDDETLSSEKLCDKLAISKSSLYNKTRSVLGTTPHSLIFKRRLSKAAILLKSSSMTVSEIIDQTGFASRTHFYELFNTAYGCSPSDFRRNPLN